MKRILNRFFIEGFSGMAYGLFTTLVLVNSGFVRFPVF